jgi:hypothetical protein
MKLLKSTKVMWWVLSICIIAVVVLFCVLALTSLFA